MTAAIAILNRSTVFVDAGLPPLVAALQVQVSRDFAPIWQADATLRALGPGEDPAPGEWWVAILDDADQAGALGYHDVTPEGLPLGKVFARTTLEDRESVTVVASHEVLEMLGDPSCQATRDFRRPDGSVVKLAYEACDAVEGVSFAYEVGGILLSDFMTPAWFAADAPGPWDFQGHVTAPGQLLTGGYIGYFNPLWGWQQLTADRGVHHSATPRHTGNRWHRRASGSRIRSTAHAESIAMDLGVLPPGNPAGFMA